MPSGQDQCASEPSFASTDYTASGKPPDYRNPILLGGSGIEMIAANRYEAASGLVEQQHRRTDSGRHRIQEVKLEPEEGPGIDVAEKDDIESSHQLDANPAN